MAFRERFKRVFRRSSVASRSSLREETKKQKTLPSRPFISATSLVTTTAPPEEPRHEPEPSPAPPKASKPAIAPPKPTKATLPTTSPAIPKPTKPSDPAPTPKPEAKKSPFPQPIPKVTPKDKSKSKSKSKPSPPDNIASVRARFAHITPRKPKYDKNGKVKIELFKPHEVPPSKYRGPFDPKHLKALADYSWGAALTERPRSIVSQCSPKTELGPGGKVSLWAGDNNASSSKLREEVVRDDEEEKTKMDSPFGSIGHVTGFFDIPTTTSTSQREVSEHEKQTDSEYSPTNYQPSEMTTGSSAADTSLHSGGTDRDTLATPMSIFTPDMNTTDDEDEDEDDNFLMLTESHMRVFDTPATPMSAVSPWSTNVGKMEGMPLTEEAVKEVS